MTEPNKNILVVDDCEDTLGMAMRALKKAGYHVDGVSNLGDLEATLDANTPDLVLMDVQMPELFGDDVAHILRNVRDLKSVIVLYSALDSDELRRRAKEAEVDGFISKNEGLRNMVEQVGALLS